MSFKISAIIFLVSFSIFAQSNDKMIEKADDYRVKGNYRVARGIYEEVLKFEPDNYKANFGLGVCLLNTSDKNKAHIYLIKAKEKSNKLPEIDFLIALSWQYAHRFKEASEAYMSLLSKVNEKKEKDKYDYYARKINECKVGMELIATPVSATITNIGPVINTKYREYSPALTRDEKKMVFTSRRPGSSNNVTDESGDYMEDIYISEHENGKWQEPRNLGKMANTDGHDASIAFSPDGNMVFIYRDDNGGDIYYSDYINQEWSEAKPFMKRLNTKYNESSICMAADGKTIYFSSDRPGGYGGRDLYVIMQDPQGKWYDPINMGPKINTPYDDDAPFIHTDGKTLYFSSKGHKTMGGFDIFKSEFHNDQWSEPENLGYPINSADDDIFFMISADNKRGYYSSFKEGGYGESDIYVISMPQKEPMKTFETKVPNYFNITVPGLTQLQLLPPPLITPFTLFSGKIYDDEYKLPIQANIMVIDNTTGVLIAQSQTESSGSLYIPLLSGVNYGIRIEKDGYLFFSENIDIPFSFDYQLYLKDIWLQKIKIGSKTVLRNLFFETNLAVLKPESETELGKLYDLLTENPNMKVEISGHTDDVGTDDYNKKLSLARAKSVADYLIKKGININRLKYKGYGKEKSVADNSTEAGRKLNRRTEFEIIGN
ncbi:MAG: OmpA family protein [Bacteroidota bacterium]|nr:OmpA family protein [Bacteroidota bacterium]